MLLIYIHEFQTVCKNLKIDIVTDNYIINDNKYDIQLGNIFETFYQNILSNIKKDEGSESSKFYDNYSKLSNIYECLINFNDVIIKCLRKSYL